MEILEKEGLLDSKQQREQGTLIECDAGKWAENDIASTKGWQEQEEKPGGHSQREAGDGAVSIRSSPVQPDQHGRRELRRRRE